MKILVNVPNLSNAGGVSSLYNILKLDQIEGVEYFNVQGLKGRGIAFRIFELALSYFKFLYKCLSLDIVHVNPSFDKKGYYRDGIYVLIARIIGRKILVYWHGWDMQFQDTIVPGKFSFWFFSNTYRKAHFHVVLGSVFKDRLINLKILADNIVIESNAADDSFLKKMNKYERKKGNQINLLFIARIEEYKGIMIVIEAMKILNKKGNYHLKIAGTGSMLKNAIEKVKNERIDNIEFLGHIEGIEKHNVLITSHILLLPSYSEGMPLCIIEGMLYGLVIVSRPIGGIPDWVKDPENGILTTSLEPIDYVTLIMNLHADSDKMLQIELTNKEYAQSFFTPSALTKRLFTYYSRVLMK